ncbi:MAG TPA: hypothetical protein VFT75_02935 [Nocardioidaceae bacterium]|nr:hypothetical protein [Nocardioidaceae bacterium]
MTAHVLLIPPEASPTVTQVPDDLAPGGAAALQALQQLVGGYITAVHLSNDTVLIYREFDTPQEEQEAAFNSVVAVLTAVPVRGVAVLAGANRDRVVDVPQRWVDRVAASDS